MSSFGAPIHQDNLLDTILDEICRKLQLDPTRRSQAETAYQYITKWLEDDPDFWGNVDAELFAYGSHAIGTTVKPKGRDEFDLDFAIKIVFDNTKISPEEFQAKLYSRLNEEGRYKGKLSFIRYGVRINYESKFHIDIMPGCKVSYDEHRMVVPDTKKKEWPIRNLKGYTNWFLGLFIKDLRNLRLFEHYKNNKWIFVEASVEELPQAVPYEYVQPLQKAVQLIKRYRDIHFEKEPELATSSIILTTIAGRMYKGETSIYESIDEILNRIYDLGKSLNYGEVIDVWNPADDYEEENKKENFANKWKEPGGYRLYRAFWQFIISMRQKWEQLKKEESKSKRLELFRELFGESIGDYLEKEINPWNSDGLLSGGPQTSGKDKSGLINLAKKQTPWRQK